MTTGQRLTGGWRSRNSELVESLFSVPEKKNKLNGDLLPVFYRAVSWSEGITAWGAGSSAWDTKTLR